MTGARGTRAIVTAAIIAAAVLFATNAHGEPQGPTAADETLSPGFDASEHNFTLNVTRDAASLNSSCGGFIESQPTRVVEVTERGAPLIVSVNSSSDTTLVVRDPSGMYSCDDDSGGELNPEVVIREPVPGRYEIWVGAYGGASFVEGALRIQEARAAGPVRGLTEAEEVTPPFPRWPPPRASARTEVARELFGGDADLGAVAAHLMDALRATGNPRASFYSAPGGFVMVAQLERIRGDARPAPGDSRFIAPRPGEEEKPHDPLSYIEALFFAPEGRYRQVMFVVTDRPVDDGTWTLTSEAAGELIDEGSADLLGPTRSAAFSAQHRVIALIYEFRKQGEGQAVVSLPGRWDARTHLTRSGVMASLRR